MLTDCYVTSSLQNTEYSYNSKQQVAGIFVTLASIKTGDREQEYRRWKGNIKSKRDLTACIVKFIQSKESRIMSKNKQKKTTACNSTSGRQFGNYRVEGHSCFLLEMLSANNNFSPKHTTDSGAQPTS